MTRFNEPETLAALLNLRGEAMLYKQAKREFGSCVHAYILARNKEDENSFLIMVAAQTEAPYGIPGTVDRVDSVTEECYKFGKDFEEASARDTIDEAFREFGHDIAIAFREFSADARRLNSETYEFFAWINRQRKDSSSSTRANIPAVQFDPSFDGVGSLVKQNLEVRRRDTLNFFQIMTVPAKRTHAQGYAGIVSRSEPWPPSCETKLRASDKHKALANQELQLRSFPTILLFPGLSPKPIKYCSDMRDIYSLTDFVDAVWRW